jgi:glycosyltransferase involved in cell wall biosynthesis
MRIGIYAPNMDRGAPSGVERYVRGLTGALAAAPPDGAEFVLLSDLPAPPAWARVDVPGMGPLRRVLFERGRLAAIARRERLDVLFCPKSAVPAGLDCPAVVTIHDLVFLRHPAEYGVLWRAYWSRAVRAAAARAAVVVCHSEATRRDVESYLPPAQGKVRVIAPGLTSGCFEVPVEDAEPRRRRLGVEGPYFLAVGNLARRKNLMLLMEAFEAVDAARLVLVGPRADGAEEILRRAAALSSRSKPVLHLDYVSDRDLAALYQGAVALVYPSLWEGFGFPLLEALAAGCPAIASTGGSLPEIAGDAALLVAPDDRAGFSAAMARLAGNPGLRRELAARGRARAASFTWTAAAEALRRAFAEAGRSRPA